MKNDRSRSTVGNRLLRSALFALGFASAAVTAHAQAPSVSTGAERAAPAASPARDPAAPDANAVSGVTVRGSRADTGARIPDDKKAAYDAEVAREAAFREYRQSAPRLTPDDKGVADPNDLSKDFPGLQSYVPKDAGR